MTGNFQLMLKFYISAYLCYFVSRPTQHFKWSKFLRMFSIFQQFLPFKLRSVVVIFINLRIILVGIKSFEFSSIYFIVLLIIPELGRIIKFRKIRKYPSKGFYVKFDFITYCAKEKFSSFCLDII